jgi:hypothetical protein
MRTGIKLWVERARIGFLRSKAFWQWRTFSTVYPRSLLLLRELSNLLKLLLSKSSANQFVRLINLGARLSPWSSMLLSQISIVKPLPRLADALMDALIDALMDALADAPSLGGMSVLVERRAASVILGSLPTVRSWNWLFAEPAQTLWALFYRIKSLTQYVSAFNLGFSLICVRFLGENSQLGVVKALLLGIYTLGLWGLRKTGGVTRKLDTSCQRRLRRVIKHVFVRTSELLRTLKDALVWF